ncbi:MAG: DUF1289 domain-containing protein [Methylobacteriaceae bacterium]|nr:DUF1289 domain-containing protein [Methylobacteriaceae bacterium]
MSDPRSAAAPALVESPCIGACWIDEEFGWCRGCGRTRAEIAAWPEASASVRRAILAPLAERRAAMRAARKIGNERPG